jgi:hypothetical protein
MACHFNKGEKQNNCNPSKDGGGESSKEEDGIQTSNLQSSNTGEKRHKIKLEVLQLYTFDLIDKAVLNLNQYSKNSLNSQLNIASGEADLPNMNTYGP